jgi:hypothetical protein
MFLQLEVWVDDAERDMGTVDTYTSFSVLEEGVE